ncbi:hypothetical protein BV25DRAFT_1914883 [Artomyces pyxidatus]|uniref:Uncharacterized protein n=1 Tax=Artomyces pyxidatus TaxID=48021 RepID=A0ACB8T5N5_9AGAM|nr:hypothetical protein BV25DRAFT_1914883 [Artomyces pyxidatus]
MTEYTSSPAAIAHYQAARNRTATWVSSLATKPLTSPSIAPSLVSDTDDGIDSADDDSDAESSHSLPPRMVLRWPDGRPDVPVPVSQQHGQWNSPSKNDPQQPYPQRARQPQGYPPSNPYIASHPPSSRSALYIPPPPPVLSQQPETIHIHPSPTSSHPQSSQYQPNSLSSRSRSMRSAGSAPISQMIYTPPLAPSPAQHIAAPSPVYAFTPPTQDAEAGAQAGASDTPTPHTPPRSHRSSSQTYNGTYGGSSSHQQRPHASSSRRTPSRSSQQSSSVQSSPHSHRSRQPPAIIYAPSNHASTSASYAYNPPRILPSHAHSNSYPPYEPHPPQPMHAPRRLGPSISDPTPHRPASRGRLYENFSRTPSPSLARRDMQRRGKERDEDSDDEGSVGSGSTYYVIPSPGQKIRIVPPNPTRNVQYPSPASPSKPRRVPNNPYLPAQEPSPVSPSQKRPFLQRLLHPQLGIGGGSASGEAAGGGRRILRRHSEGTNRM